MNKSRSRRLTDELYQSNWQKQMKPTAVSVSINLKKENNPKIIYIPLSLQ